MNRNTAITAAAARVAAHPALQRPISGAIFSIATDRDRTTIHLLHHDRPSLSSLIAWAYQLDNPTIELDRYPTGDSTHVTVHGHLNGDPVRVYTGFSGALGAELADRMDFVNDTAVASIHHLRAVLSGTYRTAIAA